MTIRDTVTNHDTRTTRDTLTSHDTATSRHTATNNREHVLTFVTPHHRSGDTAIDLAAASVSRGGRSTLVVLLDAEARKDFQRFAEAEDLDAPTGEAIARERLVEFYSSKVGGSDTETLLTDVTSCGHMLGLTEATHPTSVVLSQELAERSDLRTFVAGAHVPVLIAPAA